MNQFVDGFGSEAVQVHYDTGNISMFQFAEHWGPILGKRIQSVHLKEFSKNGTDYLVDMDSAKDHRWFRIVSGGAIPEREEIESGGINAGGPVRSIRRDSETQWRMKSNAPLNSWESV